MGQDIFVKKVALFPGGLGKCYVQGDFLTGTPPKKLNYGKPRLGESTLT